MGRKEGQAENRDRYLMIKRMVIETITALLSTTRVTGKPIKS